MIGYIGDDGEVAVEFAQNHVDKMIALAQKSLGEGPSLSHCCECGDEIPVERQKAVKGCRHCIYCKAELDKKSTPISHAPSIYQ